MINNIANNSFLSQVLDMAKTYDFLITEQLDLESEVETYNEDEATHHCRRVTLLGLQMRMSKIVEKYIETHRLPTVLFAISDGAFGSRIITVFLNYKNSMLKALVAAGVDSEAVEHDIYGSFGICVYSMCGWPGDGSMLRYFKKQNKIKDMVICRWFDTPKKYITWMAASSVEQPHYRLGGQINPYVHQATISLSVANMGAIPFATVNFVDNKAYVNIWLREISGESADMIISAFESNEQIKLDVFYSKVDKLNFITEYLKYSISETLIKLAMPSATVEKRDLSLQRTMYKSDFGTVNQKNYAEMSEFMRHILVLLNPIETLATDDSNFHEALFNVWARKYRADYHAVFGGLTEHMIRNSSSIYPVEELISYNYVAGLEELHERLECLGRLQAIGAIDVEWGITMSGKYAQMVKVNTRAIIEIVDHLKDWLPLLCECQNQDLYDRCDDYYVEILHKYRHERPEEIMFDMCRELCTAARCLRKASILPYELAECFGFDKSVKDNEKVKKFRHWFFSDI